jgi:hypothetical protein
MSQSLRELADAMDGLVERVPRFVWTMLSEDGSGAAIKDFLEALQNVRDASANLRTIGELIGSRTAFSPEFLKVLRVVWQAATFIFKAEGWVLPLMRGDSESGLDWFPKTIRSLVQANPVLPEFPFTERESTEDVGEDSNFARVQELSQQNRQKLEAFFHANDRFSGYVTMYLH